MVCENYHQKRTLPLYNTACHIIKQREDSFSLIGSQISQNTTLPILKLAETDDYYSAIDKTLLGMIHHYDNQTNFDYFFICDDDTYINFINYDLFLKKIESRQKQLEIYGCTGPINGDGRIHVTGGPGILLNRATFQTIVPYIKKYYIRHVINSDVSLALNIHHYNMTNNPPIEFVEVPEFLNPNKMLHDLKKIITYHIRDQYDYYQLYHEYFQEFNHKEH
jgi:hypothetical protein